MKFRSIARRNWAIGLALAASLAAVRKSMAQTNIYWQGDISNAWNDIYDVGHPNAGNTNWTYNPAANVLDYLLPDSTTMLNFSANVAGNFNMQTNSSQFIYGINVNAGQPQISIAVSSFLRIGPGGINKYGDQYFDFTGSSVTSSTTALTVNQDHPGGITRFYSAINNNGGNVVGLTKTGGGEVQLFNDTNQYTGLTNVLNGTLTVFGNNNSSVIRGNISVASGATLKTMNHEGIADTSDITINGGWNMSGSGSPKQETFRSLSGSGTINGGGIVLTATSGSPTTFSGTLSNLYFNGEFGHTQILTGNSSVGISADFAPGTLQIGAGGSTGAFAGFIRVRSGASLVFNRAGTLFHANQIDGAGAVYMNGPGTVILSAINTYTGGTTVNAGRLLLNTPGAATSSGIIRGALTINSGATVVVSNDANGWGLGYGNGPSVNAITIDGGTLEFTGPNDGGTTATVINMNGGTISGSRFDWYNGITNTPTLNTAASSSTATISSAVYLRLGSAANALTLNVDDGSAATDLLVSGGFKSGSFGGDGAITKTGAGKMVLDGTSTYTGTTTISDGTLQIGNGGTTGALSLSSTIINNANLTFNRSNTITQGTDFSSGGISGNGSLIKAGSGTLNLNVANSYTGGTAIAAGTLNVAEANALNTIGDITFTGGTLQYSPANQVDYSSRIVNSTGPISIDTNGQNVTFAAGLAGSNTGGLTKLGAGTLILNAVNSYTGETHINGGEIQIPAGGSVTNTNGRIGELPGSTGTVTVNGGTWNNSVDIFTGSSGTGNLTIGPGATVNNGGNGFIGYSSSGSGTVTVNSGTWTSAHDISVGASGAGTLIINPGGNVSNLSNGYIAYQPGSNGTVNLTGGTWSNSVDIFTGASGAGNLTVGPGAIVSNGGNGFIGYGGSGSGTVTVSGGTWTSAHDISVGASGAGTLIINSGGIVNNLTNGYIAYQGGSSGTVNITGGTWNCSTGLFVGTNGNANLNIGTGGLVSNGGNGFIALLAPSSGTVSITGGTWNNSFDLIVGREGDGILNIGTGGLVTNNVGRIAEFAGSTGTVNVNGGTWANSANLLVGQRGSGVLNIGAAGQVSAPALIIGDQSTAGGTVKLSSGGTLTTNGISKGTGTASFDFDGGTLRATANTTTLFSNFSPTVNTGGAKIDTNGFDVTINSASVHHPALGATPDGGLTKLGSGTLVLNAFHTYTGTTTVSGGTLRVDQGDYIGATGAGDVVIDGGGTLLVNATDGIGWRYQDGGFSNSLTIAQGATLRVTAGNRQSMSRNLTCVGGTIASDDIGQPYAGAYTFGSSLYSATYHFSSAVDGTPSTLSAVAAGITGTTNFNVTQGGASVDLLVSGTLIDGGYAGPGKLIQSGNGVMKLTGANTYTGGTTIAGGTMIATNPAVVALLNAAGTDVQSAGRLIFDYTGGSAPDVRAKIIDGTIHSSTATSLITLGYRDDGISQVLVRPTYYGDADLDGDVDSLDFNSFVGGYGMTSGGVWAVGDFDYNDKVNTLDFNHLAGNFGQTLPGATLGAVVPEPTGVVLLVPSMLMLRRRIRPCSRSC